MQQQNCELSLLIAAQATLLLSERSGEQLQRDLSGADPRPAQSGSRYRSEGEGAELPLLLYWGLQSEPDFKIPHLFHAVSAKRKAPAFN